MELLQTLQQGQMTTWSSELHIQNPEQDTENTSCIAMYRVCHLITLKWNITYRHPLKRFLPVNHGRCSPVGGWCHFLPGTECGDARVPWTCQPSPGGSCSHSEPAPATDPGSGRSPAPRLRWCCSGAGGTLEGDHTTNCCCWFLLRNFFIAGSTADAAFVNVCICVCVCVTCRYK